MEGSRPILDSSVTFACMPLSSPFLSILHKLQPVTYSDGFGLLIGLIEHSTELYYI
jgi:hypothetical protein